MRQSQNRLHFLVGSFLASNFHAYSLSAGALSTGATWGPWNTVFLYVLLISILIAFLTTNSTLAFYNSAISRRTIKESSSAIIWEEIDLNSYSKYILMNVLKSRESGNLSNIMQLVSEELYISLSNELQLQKDKNQRISFGKIEVTLQEIIGIEDYKDSSNNNFSVYFDGGWQKQISNELTGKIIVNKRLKRKSFGIKCQFIRIRNNWVLNNIDESISAWDIFRTKNFTENKK